MRRRDFIALLGGAAAIWPMVARGQQAALPMIGWLSSRTAATDALVLPAFHRALNAQGFTEGRNVSVEYRYIDSQFDRLPALLADLVGRRAAVTVAGRRWRPDHSGSSGGEPHDANRGFRRERPN